MPLFRCSVPRGNQHSTDSFEVQTRRTNNLCGLQLIPARGKKNTRPEVAPFAGFPLVSWKPDSVFFPPPWWSESEKIFPPGHRKTAFAPSALSCTDRDGFRMQQRKCFLDLARTEEDIFAFDVDMEGMG